MDPPAQVYRGYMDPPAQVYTFWRREKLLFPLVFEPLFIQPVASHCTKELSGSSLFLLSTHLRLKQNRSKSKKHEPFLLTTLTLHFILWHYVYSSLLSI